MFLFIMGFIIGMILGLIRAIIGDPLYYLLTSLLSLYMLYLFFSFFGLFWGIVIIIGLFGFLIMGVIELAKDAGSSVMSFLRK